MKKQLPLILTLACVAAFAVGIIVLFNLRFEVGDVYPPYSSLRSDPLGTMAFLESLQKLHRISVRRDFSIYNRLPEDKNTAYLHLGAERYDWNWMPNDLAREVESFLGRGGRLVITFFPETQKPFNSFFEDKDKTNSVKSAREKAAEDKTGEKKTTPTKPDRKKKTRRENEFGTSLKEKWGVECGFVELLQGDTDIYEPARVRNKTDLPLPAALDWHSGMIFTNVDKSWKTIYARGTNPVVIERRFGPGSVVMATDSYFLSNEALWKDRHADLLVWLVGQNQHVVFDEAHFGITESTGVAGLIRKYRLGWLAAGLILLAGLFIWKNSTGLVPSHEDEAPRNYIAGRDSAAGFVNLLRRNVSDRDILHVCFAEWKKTGAGSQRSKVKSQQIETLLGSQRRENPVRSYREICKIVKPGDSGLCGNKLETPNPKPETGSHEY